MVKAELNKKTPLRKLEEAVQGGVGKGNIGVIASRRGVGKTACLVHIATDKLMRDKHVIHVSYSNRVDHIITWYEDIFKEISKKRDLEDAMEVHDDIIKNRVIMNFNQDGVSVEHVLHSVKAMMEITVTDALIIDGFDFTQAKEGDIAAFKAFAKDQGIEIWFSDDYEKEDVFQNTEGVPHNLVPYLDTLDVIVTLHAEEGDMRLNLIKDHKEIHKEKLSLKLDPKTLLIAED